MSGLRGVAAGVLGLSLLQLLVSNPTATANAGTLITLATGAFNRLANPNVPLIANHAPENNRIITLAN